MFDELNEKYLNFFLKLQKYLKFYFKKISYPNYPQLLFKHMQWLYKKYKIIAIAKISSLLLYEEKETSKI